jgi:hypothetical protein
MVMSANLPKTKRLFVAAPIIDADQNEKNISDRQKILAPFCVFICVCLGVL